MIRTTSLIGAAALVAMSGAPLRADAQAAAHVRAVAGRAGHIGGGTFDCATSGPNARVLSFFGGGVGVGLPTEGYSYCGLAGGDQDLSDPTSTGVAHESAVGTFADPGIATVFADAKASIGSLSVRSSASNTAPSYDGFNYSAAEGAAYWSDNITFAGSGAARLIFGFSIDGSASVTGNSQALTLLNYRVNGGPVYGAFIGDLLGATATARNITGSGENPMPGFAVAPGSLSGSGVAYTFATDVTLGAPTSVDVGLLGASYAAAFGGTVSNDFFATARLSSIEFVDSAGNILSTPVSGVGSSGYLYDALGAHPSVITAVPEPGIWTMMVGGLALVGGFMRRRRRVSVRYAQTFMIRQPCCRFSQRLFANVEPRFTLSSMS